MCNWNAYIYTLYIIHIKLIYYKVLYIHTHYVVIKWNWVDPENPMHFHFHCILIPVNSSHYDGVKEGFDSPICWCVITA